MKGTSIFWQVFADIEAPVLYFSCTVPPNKTPWLSLSHPVVLPVVLGFYRWNILTSSLDVSVLLSHHQKELPRNDTINATWASGIRHYISKKNSKLFAN